MSDKAKNHAVRTQEEETELSEEALAEASGGGIIIEDRQAMPQSELHISDAARRTLDPSAADAEQGGYKSTIRVSRDAEGGEVALNLFSSRPLGDVVYDVTPGDEEFRAATSRIKPKETTGWSLLAGNLSGYRVRTSDPPAPSAVWGPWSQVRAAPNGCSAFSRRIVGWIGCSRQVCGESTSRAIRVANGPDQSDRTIQPADATPVPS